MTGKLDQDATGNEILRISGGQQAFLEKKGLASDSLVGQALGIGAETVVENTQTGEGGEEVGGQEQEQEEEMTLNEGRL